MKKILEKLHWKIWYFWYVFYVTINRIFFKKQYHELFRKRLYQAGYTFKDILISVEKDHLLELSDDDTVILFDGIVANDKIVSIEYGNSTLKLTTNMAVSVKNIYIQTKNFCEILKLSSPDTGIKIVKNEVLYVNTYFCKREEVND